MPAYSAHPFGAGTDPKQPCHGLLQVRLFAPDKGKSDRVDTFAVSLTLTLYVAILGTAVAYLRRHRKPERSHHQ